MEWEEFKRVTRYLEPEFYKNANPRIIFDQYAEDDEENEKTVSLEGFNKLAKEQSLFKSTALERFLRKDSASGFVRTIEELREKWFHGLESQIIGLLRVSGEFKPEMKILITKLGKLVKGYDPNISDKLWVNYILLEGEAIRLYWDAVLFSEFINEDLLIFGDILGE